MAFAFPGFDSCGPKGLAGPGTTPRVEWREEGRFGTIFALKWARIQLRVNRGLSGREAGNHSIIPSCSPLQTPTQAGSLCYTTPSRG